MAQKVLRWGLLSTARINERLIPSIRATPRCELRAVASSGSEKARRYAEQWRIPRAYGSYEALLADPDVDVVYLSLPNSLHAAWAIKLAQAGKHILCEKPLALTVEDVDRMADAARTNRVVLQDGTMMRHHPQTRKLQELIAQGAIGDVRLLRGIFTFTLTRPVDIRLDPSLGGGALWDVGSYCVNLLRTALRANPVEVQGWQVTNDGGADLSFTGQMRFPSGAVGQFFSSFQATPETQADFLGSAGRIELDAPWANKLDVPAHVRVVRDGQGGQAGTFSDQPAGRTVETLTFENINAYQREVEALMACVLDGAEPVVPLADCRENVATIVALYESARAGRPVRL
jgi:predicted dehydrogenase